MVDAALKIIKKYNENEGKGKEVGDHNHTDTLVAVIKTLAAKYQRCVQAKQSSALPSTDGPYATVTPTVKRVDTECVTAGSKPSPPHISASPASPSVNEHLAWPMAISMQLNTTQTATKSGRSEEKDEGKRPLGMSRNLEELGSKTPRIADGKWFKYHSPDLPTPQTLLAPLPVPKPTRIVPSGGNCHSQIHHTQTPPPSTKTTCFASTGGSYHQPISTRSELTETAARIERNGVENEGKHPLGVLDEIEEVGDEKPRIAVETSSKWFANQ